MSGAFILLSLRGSGRVRGAFGEPRIGGAKRDLDLLKCSAGFGRQRAAIWSCEVLPRGYQWGLSERNRKGLPQGLRTVVQKAWGVAAKGETTPNARRYRYELWKYAGAMELLLACFRAAMVKTAHVYLGVGAPRAGPREPPEARSELRTGSRSRNNISGASGGSRKDSSDLVRRGVGLSPPQRTTPGRPATTDSRRPATRRRPRRRCCTYTIGGALNALKFQCAKRDSLSEFVL